MHNQCIINWGFRVWGQWERGDNWFQFAIELKWNQWQNKPRWRRQLTPASAICCCRALIDVAAAAVASEKGDNSQLENRGQPFVSLSLRIKKRPIDCWLVGIGKALRLQLLVLCVASPSGNNKIKWQTNLAAHKQQQQQQQQATSACDSITAIVAAGWEVFFYAFPLIPGACSAWGYFVFIQYFNKNYA